MQDLVDRLRCLLLLVLFLLLAPAALAQPQDAASAPTREVTPETVQRLTNTLEDPEHRQQLLKELRALSRAQQEASPEEATATETVVKGLGGQLLETISSRMDAINDQLAQAAAVLATVPKLAQGATRNAPALG